jgi:hypothetical protein
MREASVDEERKQHEPIADGNVRRTARVCAPQRVRGDGHARQLEFRHVQVDGEKPAVVVLAVRLRMYAGWPTRDVLTCRSVREFRELPEGTLIR